MTLLSLKFRSRFCAITGWGTALFFAGLFVLLGTGWPGAQESRAVGTATAEEVLNPRSFGPVRTDSPRRTVESFLALREEVAVALSHYNDDRNLANFEYLVDTTRQLTSLFDVSGIPDTVRSEMALETALVMLDIYDRIDAPPIDDIPHEFDPERVYVMPGTPFTVAHTLQQGRSGEFLFSGDVITAAPRLLASLERTPRHTPRDFSAWTSVFRNVTGPFFPPGIANLLPERLSVTVFDTPIWKHGLLVLALSVPSLAIWVLHRQIKHSKQRSTLRSVVARAATPLLIIGTVLFLKPVIDLQLNLSDVSTCGTDSRI